MLNTSNKNIFKIQKYLNSIIIITQYDYILQIARIYLQHKSYCVYKNKDEQTQQQICKSLAMWIVFNETIKQRTRKLN